MRHEWFEDGRRVRVIGRWHCATYSIVYKYIGYRLVMASAIRYCRKRVREQDQRFAVKNPGIRPANGWAKI